MRARIHKSLLMMGVISVALAFLLAIILHYQSMQEQADRELARVAQTAAAAVSMEKALKARHTLMLFMMEIIRTSISYGLRIKGSILYDTDENSWKELSRDARSPAGDPGGIGKSFINRLTSIRKVM